MSTCSAPSDPIDVKGTIFEVHHVYACAGVRLRVLRWQPREPTGSEPIVFAPGWTSAIEGWADLMRAIAVRRPLIYIESREKPSAQIDLPKLTREDFSISQMASDLTGICQGLELDLSRAVFVGSSLGSTTILEALKRGRLEARGAFVIGPNGRFHFPLWAKILTHVPTGAYAAVIRIALFYLRNFRVNSQLEPQQMKRYEQTLLGAHPLRMKLSAQAFYPFELWEDLETIPVPVAVAYAPTDTLHAEEEIQRIIDTIPKGRAVACPSNLYMHRADVAEDIESFLRAISVSE
jgi:pimeloyl-ACP methyl ester carboxylesterase